VSSPVGSPPRLHDEVTDWTTLAPTVLGSLLALGGGLIGSWIAERRTVEREVREWARQDALRTFDDRRKAYLDLLGMLRALEEVVVQAARSNKPLDGDWFVVLFEPPNRIRVFASDVGQHAVSNAFTALLKYGRSINDQENYTAAGSAFGAAVAILVEVVRQDLGVTDILSHLSLGPAVSDGDVSRCEES
jgi:hypothetical protein